MFAKNVIIYYWRLLTLTNVTVELYFSNYEPEAGLKNETRVDASTFDKKVDFANLKSDVDKLNLDKVKNVSNKVSNLKRKVDGLDVNKLVPVLVDLSKKWIINSSKSFSKKWSH